MYVKLDLTGDWGKLGQVLDKKKWQSLLERNINRATLANALLVRKEIRRRIKGKSYSPNAKLTILLKGSTTPLVDESLMWQAVTTVLVDAYTAFVGVRRTARTNGQGLADVAAIVHEGTEMRVTPAMRGLFFILSLATRSAQPKKPPVLTGRAKELYEKLGGRGRIYPLSPTTTKIRIPGRPFIKVVVEDRAIKARCIINWQKAVEASFKTR